MEAIFASTFAVALAEMGDKTQFLCLLLAARFSQRWLMIAAIALATIVNHGLSAWLGQWLVAWIPQQTAQWLIGGSFLLIALWMLIPEKQEDSPSLLYRYGPFLTTMFLFLVVEIADKTQVATVLLAANYQAVVLVTLGTTLGMLLANLPVIFAGQWVMNLVPVHIIRRASFTLFLLLGLLAFLSS